MRDAPRFLTLIFIDFLAGQQLPDALALSALARTFLTPQRDYDISQRPDLWVRRTCDTCNVVATSEHEWAYHMQSAKHKKKVAGAKKHKEVAEFLRKRKEALEQAAG